MKSTAYIPVNGALNTFGYAESPDWPPLKGSPVGYASPWIKSFLARAQRIDTRATEVLASFAPVSLTGALETSTED